MAFTECGKNFYKIPLKGLINFKGRTYLLGIISPFIYRKHKKVIFK